MVGAYFVVPVGARQQQVSARAVVQPLRDELQRGGIDPLQIVEEQHERMSGLRQHVQER